MLLNGCEEERDRIAFREDQRFTDERTAFCAADVEDIAEFRQVLQSNIIFGRREGIGKTGAVEIEWDMIFTADVRKRCKLGFRI